MTSAPERETTYDVRIWATEKYEGKRVTTYTVVWFVAGRPWRQPHRTSAHAESFRASLVAATRQGEAFDVSTGRPISLSRTTAPVRTWYDFACQYTDMKWPRISPKYRKGVAEALVTVTCALLTRPVDEDEARLIRSALQNWGFNARRRGSENQPAEVTRRLAWVAQCTRPVSDLSKPEIIRRALDAVALRLDGKHAAGRTTHRKRAVLSNALSYAVELGLLAANPIESIKWRAPTSSIAVEKQCVPNPAQARQLLDAVKLTPRSGPRLHAFFACLYFAGLRPEEAVGLHDTNLDLPETGWGWITVDGAAPDAGGAWTDSGAQRQRRQLKHRAVGETRPVPCPPELVDILRKHIDTFGIDESGRIFSGEGGGEVATVTYTRLWQRARQCVLGEKQAATSPLARRPYDLRHAAISMWLLSSGDAAQVARWAGHGIDVLLKIYAKVLDGQERRTLQRIEETLNSAARGGAAQGGGHRRVTRRKTPKNRP
jgi:integrase